MSLSNNELQVLCKTVVTAAKEAGEYIQSQFDTHHTKQQKEGGDSLASKVVTAVDFEAQKIILNHLRPAISQFDFGLLTEESDDNLSRLEKDYFFCIDPMDGTLPFVEGRTGYAVSIAVVSKAGDPILGVVYVPDLTECYTAVKGEGVWLNDEPFIRKNTKENDTLHIYMDRSLQEAAGFDLITTQLKEWVQQQNLAQIKYCKDFGAVRNALGVMTSGMGCYFKFPKQQKGGGSIWDYAATRLFFEEMRLFISDASGNSLHLNNHESTFMNEVGVLYATDYTLSRFVRSLYSQLKDDECPN